jgi:hypothetical protein
MRRHRRRRGLLYAENRVMRGEDSAKSRVPARLATRSDRIMM